MEVADTTLDYDRNIKLPLYASAGVPEVWIENLKEDLILVYRDPKGKEYASSLTLSRKDSISVGALPDVVFKVNDLLV